ncbi:MAG: hypothetical protein F4Y39_08540 [Gemmatimonadetes bacterium]|nr:hypothetical protein [Gemmatimonadota bacterium]MYG05226.1 hypothetical protein [Candidatus Poribacteria bacterium]MYK44130.1 hypothetical protein [Gammaproteobacteria bacterium]
MLLNKADMKHCALMVVVNNELYKPGKETPYDAARFAWPVNLRRAEKVEIVLVSYHRSIIEVFFVDEWLPATKEHFPEFTNEIESNRFGFVGRLADEEIRKYYTGRRTGDDVRCHGSGFRYLP